MQALGRHASWTSAATHAILPLLVLEDSIELQLRVGIDSYRRRFGEWGGGFWLPECAYAPWLNWPLIEAGIRATCVELTGLLGHGGEQNLRPRKPHDGPTLLPIDRAVIDLVWGAEGYPSRPAYRDSHRRTLHDHTSGPTTAASTTQTGRVGRRPRMGARLSSGHSLAGTVACAYVRWTRSYSATGGMRGRCGSSPCSPRPTSGTSR